MISLSILSKWPFLVKGYTDHDPATSYRYSSEMPRLSIIGNWIRLYGLLEALVCHARPHMWLRMPAYVVYNTSYALTSTKSCMHGTMHACLLHI